MAVVSLLAVAIAFLPLCTSDVPPTMTRVYVDPSTPCTAPDFSCLKTETKKTPKAGVGEVLIKLIGSSVNPSDVDSVERLGKNDLVLGADLIGTVVEVGPLCSKFQVNDTAWGVTLGSYSDYVLGVCEVLSKAPTSISLRDAGTLPEVGMTSAECIKKLGAPFDKTKNISMVITSGSGGTGFVGIQIAKALGAGWVITATSGAANIAFVKSLGADVVTDYKVIDIFDSLGNNTVDLVFDNYGAKGSADKAMRVLKPGGTYLILPGGGGGEISKHPKPGVKQINFGLMVPSAATLDLLRDLIDNTTLKPHVENYYPFTNVSGAFSFSKSGGVVGKISVVPSL
eukprot:m.87510 g.87510  ORF g.87510 m.87510 type:complete len:341 (+) comp13112_c0_seq1:19-1041(+)